MVETHTTGVSDASGCLHANAQIRWRLGLLAATVFSLLSIYPQVHLWVTRGDSWRHAIAYNQGLGDEVAFHPEPFTRGDQPL